MSLRLPLPPPPPLASYDADSDTTCDAYVRVKFTRPYSYRTRAGSWYAIDCYEGDHYELVDTYG